MTGFGRGDCACEGGKIMAEVSSVNRRQAEIVVLIPRESEALEPKVREFVSRSVARGRVTVRLTLLAGEQRAASRARLNLPLARAYVREAHRLARGLRLPEELSLEAVLRLPGVLEGPPAGTIVDDLWPAMESALGKALAALLRTRQREGAHLAREFARQAGRMQRLLAQVRRLAPTVAARYREQLRERIRSAGLGLPAPEDARILKEVALFADRVDIAEELARLGSHLKQLQETLASREPVGRLLDFLAQEINREVNTIGSKASDAQIAQAIVALKSEVEKLREQAQNVE